MSDMHDAVAMAQAKLDRAWEKAKSRLRDIERVFRNETVESSDDADLACWCCKLVFYEAWFRTFKAFADEIDLLKEGSGE